MAKRITKAQLERELRQARLERSIAEHALGESVWQPMWGEPVNPAAQFYDGQNLIFPLGRWDNRTTSYYISEAQFDLIRWYARWFYDFNTTAKGVVRGLESYVVKCGYEYTVTPKGKSEKYVKDVQNVVDEFLERNNWYERELDYFRRSKRDGEFFVRLFPQEDGIAEVRTIEPELVRSKDGSEEWRYGIRCAYEDREKVEAYWVTQDGTNGDAVESWEMCHYKTNTDLIVKRGLSDFFCSSEMLAAVQKLAKASTQGESVRQSIAYIRQHDQASRQSILNLQQENEDGTYPVPTQFGPKYVPVQRVEPGSVQDIPKGMTYSAPPTGSGANASAILQLGYQALSAYFQVPQWMISGDTGTTNYAASLTAEAPFTRMCEKEQKLLSNKFKEIIVKAIHIACEQGVLPADVLDEVNITVSCPPVVVRNAKEETDRYKVLNEAGIMSKRTWADKEELDVETERENMRLDDDTPTQAIEDANGMSVTPEAQYARAVNRPD